MYTGPNIINEGLAFGIDSGASVANTGVPTRFFKGKPATNLASGLVKQFSSWANLVGTTEYYTREGSQGVHLLVTTGGGVQWHGSTQVLNISANTVYTISATIKWTGVTPSANLFYIRQYNSSGGQVTESGHFLASNTIDLGDGWYRAYRTFTTTSTTVKLSIQGYQYSSNANIYYQDEQLELGGQLTPYVGDGATRSDTASLIDLKRKTDISVTNINFDALGQPHFDGTNDRISIADASKFYTNKWTWEMVVKFDNNTGSYQGLVWGEGTSSSGSGTQYLFAINNYSYFHYRIQNSTTSWGNTDVNIDITPTDYNHIVWQFNGTSGISKIYTNGQLLNTDSSRGSYNGLTSQPLVIGSRNDLNYEFNGEMPVLKFYETFLTAEEIEQNYKAYKNRFNI